MAAQKKTKELQSLKEELTTVNNQLQDKVADLATSGNDMTNLLGCTAVAIIFLDNQLRIKWYTPPATRLFDLIATDLDRPIRDIASKFRDNTLQQDVECVLQALTPQEKQVQTSDGCWWNQRTSPYRTLDNRIEGVVLTFNDVTQIRRDAQQAQQLAAALRDSEQRMRLATEATAVGLWEWNVITNKVRWDAQMFRIYGIAPTKDGIVEYRTWSDSVLPEDLPRQEEVLQDTVRRLGHSRREFRIRRSVDSECRHIEAVEVVRTNAQGQAEWVVGTNLDISERKRAEAALRESEESFRSYFENVAVGSGQIDAAGFFLRVNNRYCAITGYSREELLGGMGPLDLDHPEDREADRQQLAEVLRGVLPSYDMEKRYVRKDGRVVWVHVSATVVRDAAGAIRNCAGVVEDITERKEAEESLRRLNEELEQRVAERTRALQDREACLSAILNTAADAIITVNAKGIIQSVNTSTERMFGYTASEMIGQNIKLLMPSPYREEHDRYMENYNRTGVQKILGISRELVAQRKDGSIFPVELAVSEVGRLKLFTGILRDITQRMELEHEVVEIASLEQRRIGQDLHDSVGQELTALNILAGDLAETLRTDPSIESKMVEQMVQGLQRSQKDLRAVMRGLLPVAADNEGLMAALADLADRIQQEGKATCTFDCPRPVAIADNLAATHFYLIAQEAVHNAIKHARPRNIRIFLKSNHLLLLRVQDDGIGMPAQPPENRGGLGLRIMQDRAAIIGARLTIQPAEPTGTLVTCALMRKNDETEQDEETSQDPDRR